MFKFLATCLLICAAHSASANTCPDYYRFVDFGLEGRDGVIRRGGSIFRAITLEGNHLLVTDRTLCREVEEIATDGHANPIPVVSSIHISPKAAKIDVLELRLIVLEDAVQAAEANARLHRQNLTKPDMKATRGPDFLCASTASDPAISCQVSSPYTGNVPLVIYCDAVVCEMPVLARDDQISISARWKLTAADPADVGAAISDKVRRIHDLLADQT